MDRQIEYAGQILTELELLTMQRSAYTGLAYLAQAAVGLAVSQVADGFACTQAASPNLTVLVGAGAVYSQQQRDPNAYSTLGTDASLIVKQGINLAGATLSCPAIGTAGQSTNYLVEVAFSETDGNSAVLQYFNAANPAVAWSGPNNTGASQNTTRLDGVTIQVKAGTPATTGSQTTPAPDSGFVGLWVVTVANGQTQILNGNIAAYPSSPLINSGYKLPTLPATVQLQASNYAVDTGTANNIVVALSPALAGYVAGLTLRVKVAASNTGNPVINVNGLGNKSVVYPGGNPPPFGNLIAGATYQMTYDGTSFVLANGQPAQNFTNVRLPSSTPYVPVFGDIGRQISSNTLTAGTTLVVNMPQANTLPQGSVLCFLSQNSNPITLNAFAGDTFVVPAAFVTTLTVPANNEFLMLVSVGNSWQVECYTPNVAAANGWKTAPSVVGLTAATGTYVAPPGVYWIDVEIVGGGGGGGGSFAASGVAGNGASAGGYARATMAVTPGQSIPFAVGQAGAGAVGGSGTTTGGNGGSTTFNGLSAAGGTGGLLNATGTPATAGGSASGGSLNIAGGWGQSSVGTGLGGTGGSSQLGQGGASGVSASGKPATGFGAGGGGAGVPAAGNSAGGAGTVGVILIRNITL